MSVEVGFMTDRLEELREITAEVLELDAEEVEDGADFIEAYGADSLRAIEILARIEKKYRIEIPQNELPRMRTLLDVRDVVAQYAGWPA
jgi:acyl carrier protein